MKNECEGWWKMSGWLMMEKDWWIGWRMENECVMNNIHGWWNGELYVGLWVDWLIVKRGVIMDWLVGWWFDDRLFDWLGFWWCVFDGQDWILLVLGFIKNSISRYLHWWPYSSCVSSSSVVCGNGSNGCCCCCCKCDGRLAPPIPVWPPLLPRNSLSSYGLEWDGKAGVELNAGLMRDW